jgi:dihydroflavonol-4-reductase
MPHNSSELVLVTGASGYIAGHCILQLLAQGYPVRGTLRSLGRSDEVRAWLTKARGGDDPGPSLSFVQAELIQPEDWDAAMAGVRYVLHVASPLPSVRTKHPDELIVPARDGTLNIMHAAGHAAVQRVVQTSSVAAICYGCDNPNSRLFDEADWTDPEHRDNTSYTQSKVIAERAAWAELPTLARPLEWVVINPSLVLGPVLDRDASLSVQAVAKMLRGEVPGLPNFGFSMVDVRDLADLHLRAMTAPNAAGQRFIGSGPFLTFREVAAILKQTLGERARRVPSRGLPDWAVRLAGLFDAETRGQLLDLNKSRRLSAAKAEAELGWTCRNLAETIIDTATSLAAVGALG